MPVEALLALAATLVSLRLAGALARRWRERRAPELGAWAASLLAYALASAALAWGAAAGWDGRAFRAYYLFGGLLTAPLLGVGSLLLARRRLALHAGLVYAGLAIGVAIAAPLTAPVSGGGIPQAQAHLHFFPARGLAVLGNTLGTLAVVGVAVVTARRRPLGNALLLAGVALASAGSALSGLGEAGTAAFVAGAAILLYGGFVTPAGGGLRSAIASARLVRTSRKTTARAKPARPPSRRRRVAALVDANPFVRRGRRHA